MHAFTLDNMLMIGLQIYILDCHISKHIREYAFEENTFKQISQQTFMYFYWNNIMGMDTNN